MTNTIFITGATGGFGKAFAEKFLSLKDEAGALYNFTLHGRDETRLNNLIEELSPLADNQKIYPLVADLKDINDTQNALAKLPTEFRDIDLLINNAGLALGLEPAQRCDLED